MTQLDVLMIGNVPSRNDKKKRDIICALVQMHTKVLYRTPTMHTCSSENRCFIEENVGSRRSASSACEVFPHRPSNYMLCLPTSLFGSSAVVMTQPRLTPPARYNTELISRPPPGPPAYRWFAISGLTIPANLPQKLAIPHAVPRIGAGNASGVQP
jgi:hypothetical protein